MKIDSLYHFISLVKAGSFYKASQTTYLSQQGLNKAITALEAELGVQLIERSRNGVRLTSKGQLFLPHAEKLIRDYNHMLSDMLKHDGNRADETGAIKVHATYYPVQILGGLYNKAPLLDYITINECSYNELMQRAAESRETDLYFVDMFSDSLKNLDSSLVFEPVLSTKYGIVWKDGSRFKDEPVIHRESLQNTPIAMNAFREMRYLSRQVFQEYPLHNIVLYATSPRMLLDFAATSSAVASTFDSFGFCLSLTDSEMPTETLHFTPLSTPLAHCYIGYLYNKDTPPNAQCRAAMNLFKGFLQKHFSAYYDKYPL